jgi:hypothetical protein
MAKLKTTDMTFPDVVVALAGAALVYGNTLFGATAANAELSR